MLLASLSKKNLSVLSLLLGLWSSLLLLSLPPKLVEGKRALQHETSNKKHRNVRDGTLVNCENKKNYLFEKKPTKNCEKWAAHPKKSETRCQKIDITYRRGRLVSEFCPMQCNPACLTTDEQQQRSTTVTIVGAGASGLAAARKLAAKGVDVIVVEAQSTVGGRVQDSQFGVEGDQYTVENGANWIHGPLNKNGDGKGDGNNPLWAIKKEFEIEGQYQNKTNWKFSDRAGERVPQTTAEKWSTRIDAALIYCLERSKKLFKKIEKKGSTLDCEEIDTSVAQCFRDFGYRNGTIEGTTGIVNELSTAEEDVARLFEWQAIDFEYAQNPSNVSSMFAFPLNRNFENHDWLVTNQRGYKVFLEEWAKKLEKESPQSILLNQVVTKITTTDDHATVVTQEGLTIVSDYVLCTLPLGVLKKGDVAFDPPFSTARSKSIDEMVMANYGKLYLQFETRFWGDEETILTTGDPGKINSFPWAINLDLPKYYPGSKILSFHVSDENACAIESQPIDKTVAAAVSVLRNNYGEDADITVVAAQVTNWCTNPWAYGSYSDWPTKYTYADHKEMAKHHGRVFFAGEHMATEDYGYVHGALLIGKQLGKDLLSRMKKTRCKQCQQAITTKSPRPCNVKDCEKFAKKKEDMKLERKCAKLCKTMTEEGKSRKEACKLHNLCQKY